MILRLANQLNFLKSFIEFLNTGKNVLHNEIITLSKDRFNQQRDELFKRVDLVVSGLSSLGLAVVQLDTQSLIELVYNSYNPQIIDAQKMAPVDKLRLENENEYGN